MFHSNHWKIHPGEILKEEFLVPLELSVYRLAKEIHVPAIRINDIVNQKRGITADTALRLAAFFGTTPQFWLNLENDYHLKRTFEMAQKDLEAIHPFHSDRDKTDQRNETMNNSPTNEGSS